MSAEMPRRGQDVFDSAREAFEHEQYARAVAEYTRVVDELDPGWAEAWNGRGDATTRWETTGERSTITAGPSSSALISWTPITTRA